MQYKALGWILASNGWPKPQLPAHFNTCSETSRTSCQLMISFNTCDPVEIFSNHTGSHNLLQKKKTHAHLFQSIPVIYLDASSWSSLEVKKDLLLAAWPRSRALLIRDVHICAQMSTCNSWFSLWPGIQWFCVYVPVVIYFYFFFFTVFEM